MQKDVSDHQADFEYLKQTSQRIIRETPPGAENDKLQSELQKVQWRWASIIDAAGKKVSNYRSAIDQMKQFETQTAVIKQWIKDMEEFIKPFTEPFSNLDTLQEQLKECQVTLLCVAVAEAVVDCTVLYGEANVLA